MNSRAKDFAKFGRLFLNKGIWEGDTVVPPSWVKESTTPLKENHHIYSYQWWHNADFTSEKKDTVKMFDIYKMILGISKDSTLKSYPYPDFYAHGILGQYIYVYPEKELIIVRLGKSESGIYWPNIFREIAELN